MRRFAVLALCTLAACALALWPGAATGAEPGAPASAAAKAKAKGKAKAKAKAKRCRTGRRSRCKRGKCARRSSKARPRKRRRCKRKRKAARRPTSNAWAPKQGTRPGSPSAGDPLAKAGPGVPLGRYLSVLAREYRFQLSRPALAAGDVTVELRNLGEDPHNLVISSSGVVVSFADTPSFGVATKSLRLAAGSYYLFCSLDGHEALGMHARLRVE